MRETKKIKPERDFEPTDNIFDLTAEEYAQIVPSCRFCQFLTLIHELELKGDERILDVGCGPGVLSVEIAKRLKSGHITGLDLSEKMIALAKNLAKDHLLDNVRFEKADALNLRFPEGAFDVVISTSVLHWVKHPQKFISEIYRVLKKGGKLGLTSRGPDCYREFLQAFSAVTRKYPQYFPLDSPSAYMGVRIYSDDELEKELEPVGFKIKKRFVLTVQGPVTPQSYLKRVNAVTGEIYLASVPEREKETIRREIEERLKSNGRELKATECASFVIAFKV